MKLQLTTLLYLIGNAVLILFRTIQIIFFTEPGSAFLKTSSLPINIILVVVSLLLMVSVFTNALYKPRMPKEIKTKSVPSVAISVFAGVLYIISGSIYLAGNIQTGGLFFTISLFGGLTCFLYGFTEFSGFEFPRIATLVWIGVWVYEFILSYAYYSTRPLRFRTILETLAIAFVLLFFISFGKLKSGVKQSRNIQLLYPLGLIASTLCFVSLVPEWLALLLKHGAKVSDSCISQPALLAAGSFTAFVSLYCFKKQPREVKNIEDELPETEMPFYMESFEKFHINPREDDK